jgi:hypothetical protein
MGAQFGGCAPFATPLQHVGVPTAELLEFIRSLTSARPLRVRLGCSAMSARCPVSLPNADMGRPIYEYTPLVSANDWVGFLTRYPLRESSAFERVVSGTKVSDQVTYKAAVLKLLQDDPTALADLRNLFGDLHANVSA